MVFCGIRASRDASDSCHLLQSMEELNLKQDSTAFQHVRENIDELNGRMGVQDTDLIFLKGLMDSPIMKSLVKVQDRLEHSNGELEPVATGNGDLLKDITRICQRSRQPDALELAKILQDPHLQALLETHDNVALKSYDRGEHVSTPTLPDFPLNGIPTDAIRMVGLRKNPNEPLGVTVKIENGELVIARILGGGMIDRQGLLHVGDVIKEINNVEVYTPEQLQEQLRKADTTVNLKIVPSYVDYPDSVQDPPRKVAPPRSPRTGHKQTVFGDNLPTLPCYVKALFSYDPKKDTLLPCTEIGLPFKHGDVLQILNTQDPNWWQAKRVSASNSTGLIPSQELEERRKAYVRPEFDYSTKTSICGTRIAKKKKKQMYQLKQNAEFDKAELILYEEVARMPPFQRKTLILVGPQGIGRRSLKNRLVNYDVDRFGLVIPHTSRPPREGEINGRSYYFTSQEQMEDDIAENKYLEYGEFNGHYYGTKLDSIRHVIKSGKMCVMDCNPQGLKTLNTPEFMPFVVFICSPNIDGLRQLHEHKDGSNSSKNMTFDRALSSRQSRRARTLESLSSLLEDDDLRKTLDESARLQRAYEKFFDLVITNDDFERTYDQLLKAVNALSTEPQWVPVSWVY